MAPLIIDKEEKKKQILRAAMDVFCRKGFHSAKIADIADQAGIGKGTVYEYFSTKEVLFRELFIFLTEDHLQHLAFNRPSAASARQKLENVIAATFRAFGRMENVYCLLLNLKTEHLKGAHNTFYKEQFAKLYCDFRREIGMVISEGLQDGSFSGVDPDHVATLLIATTEGVMNQWIADRSAFTLEQISDEIRRMVLRYVTC